jgi:hypothetical protein
VSGAALEGRNVLVVEGDDARAGRLIMAARALGAQAVRWSADERGRSQARLLRPDVVLIDAAAADEWAKPALEAIGSEPSLADATIVRTDAATLWNGDEPVSSVLEPLVRSVAPRAERDTKSLRAVTAPSEPIAPPKVEVAPSIAARRIASARSTEKYGAVGTPAAAAAPAIAPPVIAPAVLVESVKPPGYVFPTRRAVDVEEESSSKATSLDLMAVPSSILERANLPDTDRFARATPSRPWLPWVVGLAVLFSLLALLAAALMR